jgi:predicted acylesterase/phospholipase RssA
MTKALAISGGGDKGAFAVGVCEVLEEKGYRFDLISGTSTGALIAPMLAIGDIKELVKIYTSVKKKNILRYNWRRLFRDSIYDTKPLEKLIRKTMDPQRYTRLQSSTTRIFLCSVGFQSGLVWYWSQVESFWAMAWDSFDEFVRAVLASTNQPVLMPPVLLGGQHCFDGGVREVAPIRLLENEGATEIISILNSAEKPKYSGKLFDEMIEIGPRAIDLMSTEILNNDVMEGTLVIRPKEPLPSDGLTFDPDVMKQMMEIGRQRAREILG